MGIFDFDDRRWQEGVAEHLIASTAILCLPGTSNATKSENFLIFSIPQLLAKTIFIIPPHQAFRGQASSRYKTAYDYYNDVAHVYAGSGINFPDVERIAEGRLLIFSKCVDGRFLPTFERPWTKTNFRAPAFQRLLMRTSRASSTLTVSDFIDALRHLVKAG